MGDKTNIGWTEATWNYISAYHRQTGKRGWFCTKRTALCAHCYAEELNMRMGNGLAYLPKNLDLVNFAVEAHLLEAPLRWQEPRRIFVNSMTDFFHPAIPDWMRRIGFAVMALAKRHTFQILTKQPEKMVQFFKENTFGDCFTEAQHRRDDYHRIAGSTAVLDDLGTLAKDWPLPNVGLGVSAGQQEDFDEFVPLLLSVPARFRFVSIEPILKEVDISDFVWESGCKPHCGDKCSRDADCPLEGRQNSWIIVGGESGRKRRPVGLGAIVKVVDQCKAAGVPCYVKQDVELKPGQQGRIPDTYWAVKEYPAT